MSTDLRAHLERLDAALAAATQRPWEQHPADGTYVLGDISDGGESYLDVADTATGRPQQEAEADAKLIVAAVNALPGLLAAVRAVADLADEWATPADARYAQNRIAKETAARALRDAIAFTEETP